MEPIRIVSGGQTGADRAALDFALERAHPCGGWCPCGRLAEDGPIAAKYPLQETESREYPPRTKKNVEDSDVTVIFDAPGGKPSRGTALTVRCCVAAGKPHLVLSGFPNVAADAEKLREFLEATRPRVLNVAGNRESGTPGIYNHVREVLNIVLGHGEYPASTATLWWSSYPGNGANFYVVGDASLPWLAPYGPGVIVTAGAWQPDYITATTSNGVNQLLHTETQGFQFQRFGGPGQTISLSQENPQVTVWLIARNSMYQPAIVLASKTIDVGSWPSAGIIILGDEVTPDGVDGIAIAPATAKVYWVSTRAQRVTVTGPSGEISNSTSGLETLTGLPAGTYTFEVTANGGGGPVTPAIVRRKATLTVIDQPPVISMTVQSQAKPRPGMEAWIEASPVTTRTFQVQSQNP